MHPDQKADGGADSAAAQQEQAQAVEKAQKRGWDSAGFASDAALREERVQLPAVGLLLWRASRELGAVSEEFADD